MAIFARPAGTWPGPTLMGWVLPGPIRNRVGYGFKKKPEAGPGFIKKIWDPTQNLARLNTRHLKLQKYPVYIYSYILILIPHFFTLQQPTLTLPQSSLLTSVRQSLISAQSDTPSPSAHAISQSDTPSLPQSRLPRLLTLTPNRERDTLHRDASFRHISSHHTYKFYFFFLFLFVSKFWIWLVRKM